MTAVTDADIKKIEELIVGLGDRIGVLSDRLNDLDKRLTVGLVESDKKISVGFAELAGKIDVTNAKIDGLEKRLGFQEFIFRAIIVLLFGAIGTYFLDFFLKNRIPLS